MSLHIKNGAWWLNFYIFRMSDVQVVQKSNPESLSKEKYLGEINILSRKRKLEETSGEGDEKPEVREEGLWRRDEGRAQLTDAGNEDALVACRE